MNLCYSGYCSILQQHFPNFKEVVFPMWVYAIIKHIGKNPTKPIFITKVKQILKHLDASIYKIVSHIIRIIFSTSCAIC